MKFLKSIAVVFTLSVLAIDARASFMDYTFDIDFLSGDLSGTSSTVLVSLDGVTGIGSESFRPADTSPGALNAFQLTIGADTFTAEDDAAFPDFPIIELEDGGLSYLNYRTTSGDLYILLSVSGGINSVEHQLGGATFPPSDAFSDGIINLESWSSVPAVPVPATVWLFGSAVLGLPGVARSKRA